MRGFILELGQLKFSYVNTTEQNTAICMTLPVTFGLLS